MLKKGGLISKKENWPLSRLAVCKRVEISFSQPHISSYACVQPGFLHLFKKFNKTSFSFYWKFVSQEILDGVIAVFGIMRELESNPYFQLVELDSISEKAFEEIVVKELGDTMFFDVPPSKNCSIKGRLRIENCSVPFYLSTGTQSIRFLSGGCKLGSFVKTKLLYTPIKVVNLGGVVMLPEGRFRPSFWELCTLNCYKYKDLPVSSILKFEGVVKLLGC